MNLYKEYARKIHLRLTKDIEEFLTFYYQNLEKYVLSDEIKRVSKYKSRYSEILSNLTNTDMVYLTDKDVYFYRSMRNRQFKIKAIKDYVHAKYPKYKGYIAPRTEFIIPVQYLEEDGTTDDLYMFYLDLILKGNEFTKPSLENSIKHLAFYISHSMSFVTNEKKYNEIKNYLKTQDIQETKMFAHDSYYKLLFLTLHGEKMI